MLSLKKRFLFVHVPKTAGNTIQGALKPYSDDDVVTIVGHQDGVERFELRNPRYKTEKHSTLAEYELEYGKDVLDGLFKFACVRNPWDRCMSRYFSPDRGQVVWNKAEFMELVKWVVKPLPYYFSRPGRVEPIQAAVANLDRVLSYETLQSDFDSVCVELGIPTALLPRRNASTQTDYRKYYDRECRRLVEITLAEEIDYFGYSFD